jgi:hypothetical protein
MPVREKAVPQKVNFYNNASDLLCFAMAMAGLSNQAIQHALRNAGLYLTDSQINYRIGLYERQRREGTPTQRRAFREGKSPISQALVAQIMGNRGIGQQVKQTAVQELQKKDLYGQPRPKGNGVMRDEPNQRARRA